MIKFRMMTVMIAVCDRCGAKLESSPMHSSDDMTPEKDFLEKLRVKEKWYIRPGTDEEGKPEIQCICSSCRGKV